MNRRARGPRLVVVGGGILGTMHALEGLRRGFSVTQLEADLEPRGASVRNFGLVWVSGRAAGAELELARRARERWGDLGAITPSTGFRANGSLTVARTPGELAVLEEVAARADASDRGVELLDARGARARNPALGGELLGALLGALDATVEPRRTLAALRELAGDLGDYRFLAGRHVVEYDEGVVREADRTVHHGDLVVCCIGAQPGGVFAAALADAPLRRVRLQMLETAPVRSTITTSVADGDSLRYYPAYAGPARERLEPQDPLAAEWGAQLLLVQRLGGEVTIGDTHRYCEPFAFDLDDAPYAHLLDRARSLLGTPLVAARRWEGVYAEVTDPHMIYLRREIAPGVVVVTGPGGRGMTLSPAIAEESFT